MRLDHPRRGAFRRQHNPSLVDARKGTALVTTSDTSPRVLRVEEAARELRIGRSLVYDLIRTGRLRSFKVGSRRLIPVAAIEETIAILSEEE
ncbi:helix-turn-helix domain-containing protein [Actinoplanes sp. NPDC049118]|uniref:helix-turn-helix domain-containing protein n=1 Tax=Actinoplanes sp. NPDC049118 TaxID=3155769 RepID=UPI0033DC35EB